MGNNPTRNPFKQARLALDDQIAVDAYKAASVWGAWWSLEPEIRARFFNADEQRWIRRYGARLDSIACMIEQPRNDAEKHFFTVCQGDAMPRNDRERLWLRVQVVCRYQRALERAARTDLAEHQVSALAAEVATMRWIVKDCEEVAAEVLEELAVERGEEYAMRRRSVANVRYATSLFERDEPLVGPPTVRFMFRPGVPVQTFPPCGPAARQ